MKIKTNLTKRYLQYSVKKAVSAPTWFLDDGISMDDISVAYQPKGASSLENSLVNLITPGNKDALVLENAPLLNSKGWEFTYNTDSVLRILSTGVVPNPGYTYIVSVEDFVIGATPPYIFGVLQTSGGNRICGIRLTSTGIFYANGTGATLSVAPSGSLVLAIAGTKGYKNGDEAVTGLTWGLEFTLPVILGGAFYNGSYAFAYTGIIKAMAIYKTTLTPEQIFTISTAMANL